MGLTTDAKLPLDDLQGIVLHGYGHLWHACFVLLAVQPGRGADARRFVARLPLTSVTRGARRAAEPGPFVNVAFTHAGLVALGLPAALTDAFPRDFVEGPTTTARARLVGDLDDSAPEGWAWGAPEGEPGGSPVHVMVLLYAASEDELESLRARTTASADAAGLREVLPLRTIRLPRRQEHFGFRDGISQPVVEGAGPPAREQREHNTVKPGEIFLGHPNAFGEAAYVPGGAGSFADNGTYLVARTLSQDVPGFWRFCLEHAGDSAGAIALASRMIGRWPSGAPIAKYDRDDPDLDDRARNDFEYAKLDPRGLGCPFGAHIRRTNPRDWGVATTLRDSRTVVARHRILRRGRAYGRPFREDAEPTSYLAAIEAAGARGERGDSTSTGGERGLHFLCFNASIEQQFEFVQHQWAGNPKFGGAVNGADPLIGRHQVLAGEPPTFSIPRETTPERVALHRRFVRTRGSAYFFMPTLRAIASLDR
jgi:Dyp-type peroxidase family